MVPHIHNHAVLGKVIIAYSRIGHNRLSYANSWGMTKMGSTNICPIVTTMDYENYPLENTVID